MIELIRLLLHKVLLPFGIAIRKSQSIPSLILYNNEKRCFVITQHGRIISLLLRWGRLTNA